MSVLYRENNLTPSSENCSDSDMADLINPHWRTFSQPSFALNLSMGFFCCLLGIVAMTGNATVIYIFSKTRSLRNPSNALIVNLAISDFCMMAILCPMCFLSSISERWIFGRNACRFYGFSGALFGTVSIITMSGIALDRYWAICKPFITNKNITKKTRVKITIIFTWIYSIAWAAPPLFGLNNYVLEGFLTTCSFDYIDMSTPSRVFILAMCVGAYAAPLLLITVAYCHITWKVHTYSKRFRCDKNLPNSKKYEDQHQQTLTRSMKREIKTAKITFTVVMCWTVAWTPYAVVALIGIAGYTSALTPLMAQLPALFAKTAAVYNPFVYALSHPRYRQALRKKLLEMIEQPKKSDSEFPPRSSSCFGFRDSPSVPRKVQSRFSGDFCCSRNSLQRLENRRRTPSLEAPAPHPAPARRLTLFP